MDRDEFMELVYETFADEPDNVLANGIIEAADAYVEHEKAQLSQEGTTSDLIDRQAAIDTVHAMPGFEEIEKVIIDSLYVGDKKVTDLIASGRLRLVGFCKECKHCFPPLVCKVDGEVVQVTSDRCSICNGYVEKNGWCYKFEMRTDMRGEQDE